MFNLCILTGRLTADPELKTTTNGNFLCSFSIAVQRKMANTSGEHDTDFFDIIAWQKKAEFVTKYFKKGNMIGIEGELRTRKYQDKNDKTHTVFEILANDVHFVEKREDPLNNFEKKLDNLNAKNDVLEDAMDMDLPF